MCKRCFWKHLLISHSRKRRSNKKRKHFWIVRERDKRVFVTENLIRNEGRKDRPQNAHENIFTDKKYKKKYSVNVSVSGMGIKFTAFLLFIQRGGCIYLTRPFESQELKRGILGTGWKFIIEIFIWFVIQTFPLRGIWVDNLWALICEHMSRYL